MYDFREVWTYTDISRPFLVHFRFEASQPGLTFTREYGDSNEEVCVCDWCELPPPHRPQPVTPPVKLANSSKGTFTVKCVMFVHRTPDIGIPSMIQPAS